MTDEFRTVRDVFRHAVSAFRRADIAFGHGAADAVDEAAFIVLEALSLPIDDINPWLAARLTREERARILALVAARVETRKPAAYLLGRAYQMGFPFHVDERVIVPRSFIGELLASEDALPLVPDADAVGSVLDLCTGSGALAVIAAHAFPYAEIDAVDISADALEVARINVAMHGLEGRVALHHGDLFQPVKTKRYDLIVTNPPYVDAEAMAGLPPEFRAEPALALAGGDDGLDIVRRILADAPKHLTKRGALVCEIGRGRDILEADYPELEFLWADTEESEGEVFALAAEDFAKS